MKRPFGFVLLGLIALATLALIPASTSGANPHTHRFTVVAHNDEGTMTPAGFFDDALTQNAQASLDAPVYLDGKAVGVAETVVTVTRIGDDPTLMIECSVELPGGNVVFNGSVHLADFPKGAHLPVVGGTGRYTGARGTTLMTVTDPARPVLAFDFTMK
jgi:hypothetical protein